MRRYEYLYIIEPQEEVWKKSIEKIKEHYVRNDGFIFIEKDDIDLVIEKFLPYLLTFRWSFGVS